MIIGLAGTGRMGAAMGARLLALGHEVVVWNRTADKTKPLAAAGAKVAGTPRALAAGCEIVLSILTDAAAVEATYLGESGLLAGEVAGKLFVEMSTVRPAGQQALAAAAAARGGLLALMRSPPPFSSGTGSFRGAAGRPFRAPPSSPPA
mgnify:CR=1 FL=1